MKTFPRLFGFAFLAIIISCTLGNKQKAEVAPKEAKAGMVVKTAPIKDGQAFRKTLQALVEALKKKNLDNIDVLLHFPFYTSHADAGENMGVATDPVTAAEFPTYKSAIFNADVMRILPLYKEDDLSEIDGTTTEPYYRSLQKATDPGSKMYEVYMQFPERGTQAESFFGFVFGSVSGNFKILAVYSKWPMK